MDKMTRRELLMGISGAGFAAASAAGTVNTADTADTVNTADMAERWSFALSLQIPRIYDNSGSQGYRRYQHQVIRGEFLVTPNENAEPSVLFLRMENDTHRVNGRRVTYVAEPNGTVLWHGVGNNKTGRFATRSVVIPVEAMPSYAIGPAPTEDNSLLITLAGRGDARGGQLRGSVSGQIGCGCYEYGHVSPTRIWGQDRVVDTAAVFGTWTAKRAS